MDYMLYGFLFKYVWNFYTTEIKFQQYILNSKFIVYIKIKTDVSSNFWRDKLAGSQISFVMRDGPWF